MHSSHHIAPNAPGELPVPAQRTASPDTACAPVPSDHLMQGRKLLELSHNGAVYRLQQTRQGKLILTK